MTDTIIAALLGAGITLISTLATLLVNAYIEKRKMQAQIEQKKYETKREKLTDIYTELISIINSYPRESPNDLLKDIEYPPHYSMECFDATIKSLEIQIEEYRQGLENDNIDLDSKCHDETEIRNREYVIKQIFKIKEEYHKACNDYDVFCKTKKAFFDLYAGQEVKNNIVQFEVLIHNVFISGHSVDRGYDLRENLIDRMRRIIVDSMRNDIGLL